MPSPNTPCFCLPMVARADSNSRLTYILAFKGFGECIRNQGRFLETLDSDAKDYFMKALR